MAMSLGEATVEPDGSVTKSGVIGRFYDNIAAAVVTTIGGPIPSTAAGTNIKKAIASQATIQGTSLFDTLTTEAQAKIDASASGLQRMPSSTAVNTPCNGPGGEGKFLPIV